jgi:hypothetical protein
MKLRAKLGVAAAILTMVVAIMVPFVMYGLIAKGVARMGLHVDEVYSGGPTVRTIQHEAYSINVHRIVTPHALQSEKPFVQMDWTPVSALPEHVADNVDVDGDGQPDLRVSFNAQKDANAELRVDVEPLNNRFEAMRNTGKDQYSRLIVRADAAILVRVPLRHQ